MRRLAYLLIALGPGLALAAATDAKPLPLKGQAYRLTFAPFATGAVTCERSLDGGGVLLQAGEKGETRIESARTVTAWYIVGNASGSAVVDLWMEESGSLPSTDADTITGAEPPTLSAAIYAADTSLNGGSGWALTSGEFLKANLDSATTVTRVTVVLTGTIP